jgi:uncharacterized protein (DUF2126 family)
VIFSKKKIKIHFFPPMITTDETPRKSLLQPLASIPRTNPEAPVVQAYSPVLIYKPDSRSLLQQLAMTPAKQAAVNAALVSKPRRYILMILIFYLQRLGGSTFESRRK